MAIDDKVLMEFPVLWQGWECDSTAWVMERADGSRYLRTTNHGSPCDDSDVSVLEERLAEYARVSGLTQDAMQLLSEGVPGSNT
jgi:hypothetical protein